MRVLLIATYELGRQSFGLASLAAWLSEAGCAVTCVDLAVSELDEAAVRSADAIGLHLPMYTAAQIALAVAARVQGINPDARLFAWGLYAPVCGPELAARGVEFAIGGEAESAVVDALLAGAPRDRTLEPKILLDRLDFRQPQRAGLAELGAYAQLRFPDGSHRVVGATEASRGCKYHCRHCPVVPVYRGRFRVVPTAVVLADVAAQIDAGAQHITFGDPDFLNGPGHAFEIVRHLHHDFPDLTYDITAKVEHLLQHDDQLKLLRDTGCVLVTSAVESIDDAVLELLDKGHTRADFERLVPRCRELGLNLQPTFVPFGPWTTLESYFDLLRALVELDLVGQVTPVQLSIRLLIPRGSRLLEVPEFRALLGEYDTDVLGHRWASADPRVDELQRAVSARVEQMSAAGDERATIFRAVWDDTVAALGTVPPVAPPVLPDRATIPYLSEPWYC